MPGITASRVRSGSSAWAVGGFLAEELARLGSGPASKIRREFPLCAPTEVI